MENKVNYKEYRKALREADDELRKYSSELFGHVYVEIYDMNLYNDPVKLGVNWSAIGTVESDKALLFAQLIKAAGLVNNFKYNGYKVYYTDED